jgi:hypothetical protein
MNLKDGWNASNHNLNYLPQVITFQRRIFCFEIRKLNLQALAQCRENSAATCKVLPSGADLAAPLSFQLYAKPEFMGLQNCHNGKHSDTMIKDFRALLHNTQDITHSLIIYNCYGCILSPSFNTTFIRLNTAAYPKPLLLVLSQDSFLSSSYPKTQPLVRVQECPLKTVPVFFLIVIIGSIDKFLER